MSIDKVRDLTDLAQWCAETKFQYDARKIMLDIRDDAFECCADTDEVLEATDRDLIRWVNRVYHGGMQEFIETY